jgi:hypothetical protein
MRRFSETDDEHGLFVSIDVNTLGSALPQMKFDKYASMRLN